MTIDERAALVREGGGAEARHLRRTYAISVEGFLRAVSVQACDAGSVDIAGQILIYPCVSGECDILRFDAFVPPILKKEDTQWFFDQYVPDTAMRTDLRFAPLLDNSHAGLPPALKMAANLTARIAEFVNRT